MKLALFFFLGVAVGSAGCWSLLDRHGQFELGRRQGEIATKLDFVNAIQSLGTDYAPSDGRSVVLTVKDVEAVVVERNGIKTLRLHDGGLQPPGRGSALAFPQVNQR